jgi:hypothetical protein
MVMVEGRRIATKSSRKQFAWSVQIESICICTAIIYRLCAIVLRRLVRLITWLKIRGIRSEEIDMRIDYSTSIG